MKKYVAANPYRVATEIMLLRADPNFRKASFLIVEGKDDKTVFDNLVNEQHCRIQIAEGRSNVLASLAKLEAKKVQGVLAIIDSDFDVLNKTVHRSLNLHMTDGHSLETMLVDSLAFEKVLRQRLLRGEDIKTVDQLASVTRNKAYQIAMTVGYLRWYCLKNKLPLGFDKLNDTDFASCIDVSTFKSKLLIFISLAKNPQQTCPISDLNIQKDVEKLVVSNNHSLTDVCHGKDLLKIISIILPETFRLTTKQHIKRAISDKHLDIDLRLAYEIRYFQQSKLYKSIKQWEINNSPFQVL